MPDAVSSASTLERPAVLRQVEIPPTDLTRDTLVGFR